jgi:hypothetical protein
MVLGITKERVMETAKTAAQTVLIAGGIVVHAHPSPIVSALGSIAASGTMAYLASEGLIKNDTRMKKLANAAIVATSAAVSVAQGSLMPVGQAAAVLRWTRAFFASQSSAPHANAQLLVNPEPLSPVPAPTLTIEEEFEKAHDQYQKDHAQRQKDFLESKNSVPVDQQGEEITPDAEEDLHEPALGKTPMPALERPLLSPSPVVVPMPAPVSSSEKKRKVRDAVESNPAPEKKSKTKRRNADEMIMKQELSPVRSRKRKR